MTTSTWSLEEAEELCLVLRATGLDPFGAIEPAIMGDATLARTLWMRALRLVDIPAGTFRMGARNAKPGFRTDGRSGHTVRIPHSLRIGAVPVTQGAWMALMGNMREGPLAAIHGCRYFNPENDPDLAAVDLTWGEIRGPDGFLDRLNGITAGARSAGQIFRLPTEEEWEYACRAGTASRWSFGDDLDGLDAHAWTKRNSGGVVHPVGRKAPNLWGLYDMHGNVGEQCFDAGDPFNLGIVGPQVVRGGSYQSGALQCRSTAKSLLFGVNGARDVGFRVVLSKPLLASREQGNGPGQ